MPLLLSACDEPLPGDSEAPPIETSRVTVVAAKATTFGEQFVLSGTLTAERQAQLSVRADGLISRVHVDAGDKVQRGQVLLELDPALSLQILLRARAEAAQATASVREAKRLLSEAQQLIKHNAIAATEVGARASALDLALATEETARASVREQEEIIVRHALPAPFSGTVAEKHSEIGEWVNRGTPVLSLVATDRVRLDLRAPQERFGQIDENAQVRVFADSLGGTPLPARISAQVPVTDPSTRTFLLRLLVDDPDGRLLPGTSARAEISLSQPVTDAVSISRDALLRQPDGSHNIYAIEESDGQTVVSRRLVQILNERDGLVAISDDSVKEGERIVIRGNEALADGQTVEVMER
ncbi:MAG: efflux RND transporter periplasmic adaptor subunit [Gammaproteobacteria bacterium]|nr:efflux RND transporter periplasmic adaptor subunit [Gammaproteobacteria bacterium]MBU1491052.1 efflux RND transporter periplasmic adaptor subunit [Gammaproteobacteria bacterium]MBU2138265.1 efflux RND transporter periplasmic adaptor subunit [Gammaproteobacteria bacterium]MBU2216639.1 efflux RND transporter periplasmic adaptor subunit [Gammaproteobacteria bacterium]MBU2322873.1 efflux RND transporter periplasmic adaptor subunit [Gammaproteobacteria bacterium]